MEIGTERWLAVVSAILLLISACTTTDSAPSTSTSGAPASLASTTTFGPVDLSARPLVWLQPLPELVDESLPFADGSSDFYQLFPPGAPWESAASRTHVFGIYGTYVRHYATDDDLLLLIEGLAERGLTLAMEVGPLPGPDPSECIGAEGFGGIYEIELIERIKDLGGTVGVVALDEPYAFGHKADGPTDCQWTIDRVATEVAEFVRLLREVEPDVIVGDIEPMWALPEIGAAEMAAWFEAYRAASGEEFAFIHMDADWNRSDWANVLLEVERVADQRGIPVGMIYFGGEATSDETWTRMAAERMFTFEQVKGGTPDHVVIQSWNDYPHRVLPDDDPSTLTGLLTRYFGQRTQVELRSSPSEDVDGPALDVSVTTVDGSPVSRAVTAIEMMPLDGQPQTHSVSGVVPSNADSAVVVVRFNAENAGPGQADVRLREVSYRESDQGPNLVPDGQFIRGLDTWTAYGEGTATSVFDAGRTALQLTAQNGQPLFIDSSAFGVTPGAEFVFTVEASVPMGSAQSGFVAIVFLDDGEVMRSIIELSPVRTAFAEMETDAEGIASFRLDGVSPGRYLVRASSFGDIAHWAAYTEQEILFE